MKSKTRLDRRTIRTLERFLEERLRELRQSVQRAMAQRERSEVGRPADSAAVAPEVLQDEIQVSLMDRHSRQVAQIEAALERLGCDEYGLCHDCGEFIGLGRLRALPFAPRCRPCQARAERAEGEARPPILTMATGAE